MCLASVYGKRRKTGNCDENKTFVNREKKKEITDNISYRTLWIIWKLTYSLLMKLITTPFNVAIENEPTNFQGSSLHCKDYSFLENFDIDFA